MKTIFYLKKSYEYSKIFWNFISCGEKHTGNHSIIFQPFTGIYSPAISGEITGVPYDGRVLNVHILVELPSEEDVTFVVRLQKVNFPQSYTEKIIQYTGLMNYSVHFDGLDEATEYEALVTPELRNSLGDTTNIGSEWTGVYILYTILLT